MRRCCKTCFYLFGTCTFSEDHALDLKYIHVCSMNAVATIINVSTNAWEVRCCVSLGPLDEYQFADFLDGMDADFLLTLVVSSRLAENHNNGMHLGRWPAQQSPSESATCERCHLSYKHERLLNIT